jgi:hypothetical protein
VSKFRELQAIKSVLVGVIEELKIYIPGEGHRFELKEAHYRAQLESQKRWSSGTRSLHGHLPFQEAEVPFQHNALTSWAAVGKYICV